MENFKHSGSRDVHSVSKRLKEQLQRDFHDILKPYLQQDFSRPRYQVPTLLYQATVGTGKTHQMVGIVGQALEHGLRPLIRVPTILLAEEVADNINKSYPNAAAVWYGREQDDPSDRSYKMCPRHEVVSQLIALNAAPELACGDKHRGYCRFHPLADSPETCGYRRQDLRDKSVVVVAGDEIMTLAPRNKMKRGTKSKYVLNKESEPDLLGDTTTMHFKRRAQLDGNGDFDLVILDETNPLGMIKGINDPRYYKPKQSGEELELADTVDQAILFGFSVHLYDLLQQSEHRYFGSLPLPEIMCDSISTKIDILEEVSRIADKYLRQPLVSAEYHRIDGKAVEEINKKHVGQRKFLRMVSDICDGMIHALAKGDGKSPRLQVVTQDGDRKLNVCTVSKISTHYGGIPIVIFDATPRTALLEAVYGTIMKRFEATVKDGPSVKRFQLLDKPLSYQTLDD